MKNVWCFFQVESAEVLGRSGSDHPGPLQKIWPGRGRRGRGWIAGTDEKPWIRWNFEQNSGDSWKWTCKNEHSWHSYRRSPYPHLWMMCLWSLRMVMFYSFVSLPEGMMWKKHEDSTIKHMDFCSTFSHSGLQTNACRRSACSGIWVWINTY